MDAPATGLVEAQPAGASSGASTRASCRVSGGGGGPAPGKDEHVVARDRWPGSNYRSRPAPPSSGFGRGPQERPACEQEDRQAVGEVGPGVLKRLGEGAARIARPAHPVAASGEAGQLAGEGPGGRAESARPGGQARDGTVVEGALDAALRLRQLLRRRRPSPAVRCAARPTGAGRPAGGLVPREDAGREQTGGPAGGGVHLGHRGHRSHRDRSLESRLAPSLLRHCSPSRATADPSGRSP